MLEFALPAANALLTAFVWNTTPYFNLPANSEQRQPLYLGATPNELGQSRARQAGEVAIPENLRLLGSHQARAILQTLQIPRVELEAWPVIDDDGRLTWAFARYRT